MTQLETLIALLAGIAGLLTGIFILAWRTRGYVDRLNTTDSDLAKAISDLGTTMVTLHRENQTRFRRIESKLK